MGSKLTQEAFSGNLVNGSTEQAKEAAAGGSEKEVEKIGRAEKHLSLIPSFRVRTFLPKRTN